MSPHCCASPENKIFGRDRVHILVDVARINRPRVPQTAKLPAGYQVNIRNPSQLFRKEQVLEPGL
jgi:hypothetical protein